MEHTTIRGKIYQDNSGVAIEIPVILTEFGPLIPLVDYLMEKAHVRSQSWMSNLAYAVSLLLDYTAANYDCFNQPKDLFSTFVKRLSTGTVGQDGFDPSGLYWSGHSENRVRKLVGQLSEFSDWMAERHGTKPLNPLRQATRSEEMLAWAAWHHRHDRATYHHTYLDDRKMVSPKVYPDEFLAEFRRWFRTHWLPNYGVKYFKKKDPSSLMYLDKLPGLAAPKSTLNFPKLK